MGNDACLGLREALLDVRRFVEYGALSIDRGRSIPEQDPMPQPDERIREGEMGEGGTMRRAVQLDHRGEGSKENRIDLESGMDLVQGARVEATRRPVLTHQLRVHLPEVRGPEERLGFGRAHHPHARVPGRERLLDPTIEAHGHVGANAGRRKRQDRNTLDRGRGQGGSAECPHFGGGAGGETADRDAQQQHPGAGSHQCASHVEQIRGRTPPQRPFCAGKGPPLPWGIACLDSRPPDGYPSEGSMHIAHFLRRCRASHRAKTQRLAASLPD